MLAYTHYSLVFVFLATVVFSVWVGARPSLYYALFSALFVSAVVWLLSETPKRRSHVGKILIVTIIIVSVCQAALPAVENRLMISGSDQWGDIHTTLTITATGSFNSVVSSTANYYYSSIPLFSILIASLTLLTGNVYLSYTIVAGSMGLIMGLAIFLFLWKLAKTPMASVVGVFAFLSIPRLAIDQAIPPFLSLALGALLILMLVNYVLAPNRRSMVSFLVVYFSSLLFHPEGIFALLVLGGAFIVAFFIHLVVQKYPYAKLIQRLFLIMATLSVAYWFLSSQTVLNSLITPIQRLFSSITTAAAPSTPSIASYTPRYFGTGQEIYSFAWAVPVGIAAAYVTTILFDIFTKRVRRYNRDSLRMFAAIGGLIALPMLLLAFVSILRAPGASIERYVDNVVYLLLLLPMGVACSQLISNKKKAVTACLVGLLCVFVFIGASSPDWAPRENPTFTAVYSTFESQIEANQVAVFLPNNILVYDDHDISVGGVAAFANVSFSTTGTNQITSNVLDTIKDGSFSPFYLATSDAFFILKTNEVQNSTAIDNYLNINYNSGFHYVVTNPYSQSSP